MHAILMMPVAAKVVARRSRSSGFTLLEVLVALVIVGTALGASLRAVGSLTRNSGDLRATMLASWAAENRLVNIRISNEWPALGKNSIDCSQDDMHLTCEENVSETPNPNFRRMEINVFDADNPQRRLTKIVHVVSNGL